MKNPPIAPASERSHRVTLLSAAALPDGHLATLSQRIDLLNRMLAALDQATPAGIPYQMRKIVLVLRREAIEPELAFQPAQCEAIVRALAELEHQAARLAPDPSAFEMKVQMLVDLFAVVAGGPRN